MPQKVIAFFSVLYILGIDCNKNLCTNLPRSNQLFEPLITRRIDMTR